MSNISKQIDIKRLVGISLFAALAYSVTFVFRIPVAFLTFDAKDTLIAIAALMYGPVSGIIIAFLAAFLEFITISGTGIYGFIMNFVASATFSATAALVYKYKKNISGAIISFYSASVAMVAVMLCLNLLVTPFYMGCTTADVVDLLPKLILPFNMAKGLLNSAFAMLLYKPITVAMRRAKLLQGEAKMSVGKASIPIYASALVTLAAAVIMFVILKK